MTYQTFYSKEEQDYLIQFQQDLHANPELSFEEYKTQIKIIKALKKIGIKEIREIAGSGVIARIKGTSSDAPVVAIRGDIDALPIQEDSGLAYASKNKGVMHACGHDVHASWVIAAATILMKSPPKGDVVLLFQPAEEIAKGALKMIEEGALEGVSAIIGGHVDRNYSIGQVVAHDGAIASSSDRFSIIVKGKGGHGARPHECQDPIPAAASLISAIHTIVSRNVPPSEPAVISIGSVQAGVVHNIIPDEVHILGSVRTLSQEVRDIIGQRLQELGTHTAKAFGIKIKIDLENRQPCIINDEKITQIAQSSIREVLGDEGVVPLKETNMASEDFAYYLEKVPGCFMRIGARKENDKPIPAHSPEFHVESETVLVGGAVCAIIAKKLANKISK